MKQEINIEPKRHHYVPRTYLNHFAHKNKNEYQIYVMDKKTKNIFKTNIKNVAVEKDFYTVETIEDKYYWEKYYSSTIEPIMGEILPKLRRKCETCLIQNHSLVIDEKTKKYLSIIIAIQFLRGIHTRNFERKIFLDTIPELFPKIEQNNQFSTDYIEKNDSLFKEIIMKMNIDYDRISEYSNYIFSRIWILYKIVGNDEFITSDSPVMIMNSQTLNVEPFKNGLAKTLTIIFYPISSKLLLGISQFQDEESIYNSLNGKLVFLKDNHQIINIVNKKQLEQCYRQVYAHSKEILKKLK